jgi:hypothetical protein
MKKYKTTSKHPGYKEGLIIKLSSNDNSYLEDHDYDFYYDFPIDLALKKGWIEEIQEPEFTRNDMIEFAKYYQECRSKRYNITKEYSFELWLKQKKEDK